jgi:hypothetical protein
MQQDLEDKKNEIIIEGLEKKIKDHEATLEKRDFALQTMKLLLFFEPKAKNTFPSFCTQRSMKLLLFLFCRSLIFIVEASACVCML